MRHYGIDLARIILMIMVVAFHTVSFGNLNYKNPITPNDANFLQSHLLASFTVVAVNCFVMISGYVRIKACPGKLAALLIPVVFYDVVIGSVFSGNRGDFRIAEIIFRVPNSLTETYWFVESYIVLFLISPFLNRMLGGLSLKSQASILGFGCFLFFVLPMSTFFDLTRGDRGFGIETFVMLYVTGDFLRRIRQDGGSQVRMRDLMMRASLPGYMVFSFLTFMLNIAWVFRGREDGIQGPFYGYNILTVYIAAACLLSFFLNLDIRSPAVGKLIRFAAPLAFPVYIIHEQPDIRTRIYEWFAWYDSDSPLWLAFVPLSSILIFMFCAAVEKFRMLLLGNMDSAIAGFAIRSHTWLKGLFPKLSKTP